MTEHFFTPATETFPIPEAELKAKKLVNELIALRNTPLDLSHLSPHYDSECNKFRQHGLELAIGSIKRRLLSDWSDGYEPYDLGDKL